MQLTKIDERGRILLPKDIRKELNLKPSEEMFVMNAGKEIIVLKKVNVKKIIEEIIEKVKGFDLETLERELEKEGNKIAKKKYPKIFS
ncbi:MAG: AbrB/MazE/SpoVT family DNA-binding domain-containing protein [Euryarchaeota archaeon]|nr:AbrB/MazE/SpoVT family DNA-binding domain-containing protein [Euryarchaeota archaeon]